MKILLAWYGSFARNGTLGDYLSVKALAGFLESEGFQFDCASSRPYEGLNGRMVSLDCISPSGYDTLVFCCGPVMKSNRKLVSLFEAFAHAHKIGVGVSLFQPGHFNYYNPFDYVLSRENTANNHEDIAIIAPASACPARSGAKNLTVGLVLRGKQGEYGAENCKSDAANQLLRSLARDLTGKNTPLIARMLDSRHRKSQIVEIDNHLESCKSAPEEIECRYRQCDLILTTRFHGAIMALRNDIPFIAVDQISGGAKVAKLLGHLGYPHVREIDRADARELRTAAARLLENGDASLQTRIKAGAQNRARETLAELGAHLVSRLSRQFSERA